MFTIRGRLVCLTIRVRPSTQDVDELARPHFYFIGAWFCFDLRVDKWRILKLYAYGENTESNIVKDSLIVA